MWMEYYSAVKRNRVVMHAMMWLNLENIVLSEISQIPKTPYCKIPFIRNVQNWKIQSQKVA